MQASFKPGTFSRQTMQKQLKERGEERGGGEERIEQVRLGGNALITE